MKVSITLEEALTYAAGSEYNLLPVFTELLCDDITPMEVLRRLRKISAHCFLLESVSGPEAHGRYTFLGYDPKTGISCRNGKIKIGDVTFTTEHPADDLRRLLQKYRSPKLEGLPPFTGGLVGYSGAAHPHRKGRRRTFQGSRSDAVRSGHRVRSLPAEADPHCEYAAR